MNVSLATVSDLNSEGWGVVRTEAGEVVFVPGAWPGDEIEFSILKRGKFTLGKLEKILKKSSAHRENTCPSRDPQTQDCVACPWAGIHYKDQLEAKNKKIDFLINRFKFAPKIKNPIHPSPEEFHYRNRVKLHREEKSLGYKDPVTLKFNPISECKVVEEWINLEIKKLSSSLDENSPQEIWIQKGHEGEFNQGNTRQNNQIKEILQKELNQKEKNQFLELFCGSGNFSEVLKNSSSKLLCYEGSQSSLQKIDDRKWSNVETFHLNLYSSSSLNQIAKMNQNTQQLFLDPPRSGFKELGHLTQKLPKLQKIFYLSCNPITFFRDVVPLSSEWTFEKLYSFDMFPQTPHIEVMGVFHRSEARSE